MSVVQKRAKVAPTSAAILALLDDMTADELKRVTIGAIRENRRRLAEAQALFDRIEAASSEPSHPEALQQLRDAYHLSMIVQNAYHQMVSILINALGYVPIVDDCGSEAH